jgi:hypothetical protein
LDIRVVTETFPPDINGVATTLGCLVAGLRDRGHRVVVTCPAAGAPRDLGEGDEVRGLALPFYREVRFGLPRRRAFLAEWREDPPDVVHIATEGPLGASALAAARALDLPVTTSLHTNFHAYARAYRLGWLTSPVMRYLRRFHNRSAKTFIPTANQAAELEACATEWGMDVLIEVHDRAELDRALNLRSSLIGINNRNLKTFETSLDVTRELAKGLSDDRLLIAESGLRTRDDLADMAAHGARAFLIGESLMRQADVAAATRALLRDPVSA